MRSGSGSCACATTATRPAWRSTPPAFAGVVARRDEVVAAVRGAGFRFVALDLEGFRSGSLNRGLNTELTDGRNDGLTDDGLPGPAAKEENA